MQTKEADRFQGFPEGFQQREEPERSSSAERGAEMLRHSQDRRFIELVEEALCVRCQGIAAGDLVKMIDDGEIPANKVHTWPGCRVAVKLTDAPKQAFSRGRSYDEDRAVEMRLRDMWCKLCNPLIDLMMQ